MTTINKLNSADILTSGDQFPIYSGQSGDARKIAASVLLEYVDSNLVPDSITNYYTQYATPSADAFSLQVYDTGDNTHMILTPAAGYITGTIIMPMLANCVDKQYFLVNCTQALTALTLDGNGATIIGAPSAFVANDFFKLKFDLPGATWYRVS